MCVNCEVEMFYCSIFFVKVGQKQNVLLRVAVELLRICFKMSIFKADEGIFFNLNLFNSLYTL